MRLAAAGIALAACSAAPETHGPPWIDGPPLPTARSSAGVAAIGDSVVVIGGDTGGAATTAVDAINAALVFPGGSAAAWMSLPALPQAGIDVQVAAVGTRMFVLGGFDGTGAAFGNSYVLDTSATGSALTWTAVTALPTPRGGAAVAVVPPKIFLFGGATSATGGALASVTSYDAEGDFWCPDPTDTEACPPTADIPDLPAARATPAAIVQNDGTFVVAGGSPSPGAPAAGDVAWLPPALGSAALAWIAKTPMPVPLSDCAYGSIGGRLVCATAGSAFSYEPALDGGSAGARPWCHLTDPPVLLVAAHGAALGARLFVAGGVPAAGGSATDGLLVYSSGDDPAVEPIPDTGSDPKLCPE